MAFPDCVKGPALLTNNLVCNTSASSYDRAVAIVGAMTTAEKLVNMVEYDEAPILWYASS